MPEDELTRTILKMIDGLKAEARMNFESFLLHGHKKFGGTLEVFAPCAERKRVYYEAHFSSELYTPTEVRTGSKF